MRSSTAWCRAAGRPEFTPLAGLRAAQLVVVAPATTDFLGRAVRGRADNLRSAYRLETTARLVHAMNLRRWKYPRVHRNTDAAEAVGYPDPDVGNGALAVGEGRGAGRVPEPETILAECGHLREPPTVLDGRAVVGTAGPTRGPIDPVRGFAILRSRKRRSPMLPLGGGAGPT